MASASVSDTTSILRSFVGRQITCTGEIPRHVLNNPSLPISAATSATSACELPMPARFEWNRQKLVPIRDQGMCTSCWAFSVSDMIADRLLIYTNGRANKNLSVQYLLSCFTNHEGCSVGGSPEEVYGYIAKNGLPLDTVYPYEQYQKLEIGQCQTSRLPPTNQRVYIRAGSDKRLCSTYFSIGSESHQQNIRNMQMEILLNGPIVGTLAVYDSLYKYSGAPQIYQQDTNSKYHGGHSCEVLGWNLKSAVPYWIVRTPWGDDWPRSRSGGIVYVKFGVNECGIEARASSAMVEIPAEYMPAATAAGGVTNSQYYTLEV